MMDPIIKTPRISPARFSLNFQNHKAKPQPANTEERHQEKTAPLQVNPHKPAVKEAKNLPPPVSQPVEQQTQAPMDELEPMSPQLIQAALEEEVRQRELKVREEAIHAARQQGLEEGRALSKKELETSLKQIGEIVESLKDLRESLLSEMENTAVEVIFEAVTKIVGQAAVDYSLAKNMTHEIVEQVRGRQQLTIRVSPRDFEIVQTALSKTGITELSSKEVHVIPDNIVQLGGCVIETEAGSLDARLEIKLQRLKDMLLSVRKSDQDA